MHTSEYNPQSSGFLNDPIGLPHSSLFCDSAKNSRGQNAIIQKPDKMPYNLTHSSHPNICLRGHP